MSTHQCAESLRMWASGVLPTEAGAHLLITAAGGRLLEGPWIRTDNGHVWFEPSAIDEAGGLSGGERRLLQIAASLVDPDHTVALSDVLTGLDQQQRRLVLAAVAHAAGCPGVMS